MPSESPKPVAGLVINGVIRKAYCSACHAELGIGEEQGTREEQEAELEATFQGHLQNYHPAKRPA